MSPVSGDHDEFLNWFTQFVGVFVVENELGKLFGPEYTVRLPKPRTRRLPDKFFVATPRLSQVRQNHFEGAPDAIFEVVSPDSVSRDWREKFLEFEKAGVREYWIIDRDARRVEAYKLARSGKFEQIHPVQGRLRSAAIAGLHLKLDWLLAWPLPKASACLRELGVRI
jgi:Uma2 family endonuclease